MNKQTNTTPKDFFYHLTATIALYSVIIAVINLYFGIINYYFPDALAGYFYSNTVAWPISMLVVLVPILYVLEWLINKDIKAIPEKSEIWARRWRIFLTLFLAGAVMAGDLIVLINTYLNGEISARLVYKVLAVIVIMGVVFGYYILDKINPSSKIKKLLSYFGLAVVMASVILGFITVGSPTKQRNLRFDSQRIADLQNIQSQVVNYWQQKGKLPAKLIDLKDPLYGSSVSKDPENNTEYGYSIKGDKVFEICATFALKYDDPNGKGGYVYRDAYMLNTVYPVMGGDNDDWKHDVGLTCFSRTIDPDKFPPIDKPIKY